MKPIPRLLYFTESINLYFPQNSIIYTQMYAEDNRFNRCIIMYHIFHNTQKIFFFLFPLNSEKNRKSYFLKNRQSLL